MCWTILITIISISFQQLGFFIAAMSHFRSNILNYPVPFYQISDFAQKDTFQLLRRFICNHNTSIFISLSSTSEICFQHTHSIKDSHRWRQQNYLWVPILVTTTSHRFPFWGRQWINSITIREPTVAITWIMSDISKGSQGSPLF